MTAQPTDAANALLDGYAERLTHPNPSLPLGTARGVDALAAARGASALLPDAITRFGTLGLQTRRRTVERLIADDGITYGGSTPDRPARPWSLDPLPLVLEAREWATLEAGLAQRARLLDAVMADLIGPRRLLHFGVLPAEIVAGHPGFLVPAHDIKSQGGHALPMVSFDLTRDPSGAWTVLADRTQAPSGAGYAMANRRIIARAMEPVHRSANLRRLRGWFDILQAALQDAAPTGVEDVPRVVLLTSGPGSETAYDQGLLSILLGHPLAQSDDLVLRDGRLWLRTTGRLEAVDVVLRRVDPDWCDSLDLLPQSRLGVPGLVAAARRGAVSIVNPLRAGLLENPGLVPFLGAASRYLLGEDLALPQPATWWCGDEASRRHVLAHLGQLIVKPIARAWATADRPGWLLSAGEQERLRARIEAQPWAWSAQEPVVPMTAPVVTNLGLEPRNAVLRTFGVALDDDVHFLPGGLGRVAATADAFVVTNQSGAASKDVWVFEAEGVPRPRVDLDAHVRTRALITDAQLPGLTPRSADNLYWMGRYAERAEFVSRMLIVADNMVEDHAGRPGTPGHAAMRAVLAAVTEVTTVRPGFTGPDADGRIADPGPHLVRLLTDADTPGTLANSVRRAVNASFVVRELLSLDTSAVLSRLQRTVTDARADGADVAVQHFATRSLDSTLALSGLISESLVRDATWAFLDAGRRVERAQTTLRLLRNTIALPGSPVSEAMLTESVLRVGDSLITYRRRMAAGVGSPRPVAAALDLLVTDATNPRSILFQVEKLRDALVHAPDPRVSERVRQALTFVRGLDLEALSRGQRLDLVDALVELEQLLRGLSDAIVDTHFRAQAPQSSFAVAELAGGRA
ncbi:circularly permuted type 2 ATP-grasp protein [Propioniciclava sp.]|uniref:circularly permuted type 2 ATP-grasp protein n=1 Tax=Propioniciclava sp. TaxID=2038686 RepID=UPI00262D2676|nr:circularly permuted type 2 ATP-grasp protein [Propioniciclava sp.]